MTPEERRAAHRGTLTRAMAGIGALDVEAVLAEVHPDGVLQLPYEPAVPDLDRAGFGDLLRMMFGMYRSFDISFTAIHDLLDPDLLVATYTSDCHGRDHDVHYANTYIGVFTFADGLITVWREYDDPGISRAATDAFGAAMATASTA